MRPLRFVLCLGVMCGWSSSVRAAESAPLRLAVSDNDRYLVRADGRPFFYLGDTAWELFHRLSREDADVYLADRARKGFTVIQAVVLAEFGGLTEPNPYGHLPLRDRDPAQPVDEYFQHVDYIVERAASLGMCVGMLPTWGDKVNKKWGQGPEIFTPKNARVFGEYLGRRYKDRPIIWILGGDRPIEKEEHRQIFNAMAEGLAKGDGGAHLMTYHPSGGHSSSEYVHDAAWLDFNMLQSGHAQKNKASYEMIARDLARKPPKPTLDGEPCYEDHPVRKNKDEGWFDEWDVRKLCYWGLFAGAHGHTYGAHPVWQMWDGVSPKLTDPRRSWKEALALPGAAQAGYARRLMQSRPFLSRIPDHSLLVGPNGEGANYRAATRDQHGGYAMIYSASGRPFTIDLKKLPAKTLRAWWFDPRRGEAQAAGVGENEGPREFRPPTSGAGQD
ncbi:MAG: glycoside hydrolase family 140 protein, partial [Verrucomicrobiota bacterium]|nr:glycoside hydrolase family 140 protein [Verrucomicrobiota bacterium]